MRTRSFLLIILIILFLIDLYVFQAVKEVVSQLSPRLRAVILIAYWTVAVLCWLFVLSLSFAHITETKGNLKLIVITIVFGIYIGKLLASVFFLADDIRRGGVFLFTLFQHQVPSPAPDIIHGITRSQFLSRIGLLAGGGFLATLVYGFSNKYNYKIRRITLTFSNLPSAFKGLKIVQLSDIHSGSFDNYEKVKKGAEMVQNENPDVIFFTGDLVNNRSEEIKDYQSLFTGLHAPLGIFAILGNHDYGDYVHWESEEAKAENLEQLKKTEAEMGWHMLNNDHTFIEKGHERIAVIGVENWSAKARFPKYGDLKKAYKGTEDFPFKILLSHDPSHWDAQVRTDYPDIDLMLAGHTHGMQFGVEIPGIKWSPIQYSYKEWAGLYKEGKQYLYVNRGFGFLGYPGRVGILPEITVITLA